MRADAIITHPPAPPSVASIREHAERWRKIRETVKPGAHALVFTSRNADLLSFAIRLGGFEIRDTIAFAHAGTGCLYPAWTPIILARAPLTGGSVAANVIRYRTGAMNIDACRIKVEDDGPKACVGTGWAAQDKKNAEHGYRAVAYYADQTGWSYTPHTAGRWPANVIHDGSSQVLAAFDAFGERTSGKGSDGNAVKRKSSQGDTSSGWGMRHDEAAGVVFGDTGSSSRFFQHAPDLEALREYLVRLIVPPNGIVIDPFAEETGNPRSISAMI